MNDFLLKCLDILDIFVELANNLFDWLLTEIDLGVFGVTQPIVLLSFGTIIGWLITRIILSINS